MRRAAGNLAGTTAGGFEDKMLTNMQPGEARKLREARSNRERCWAYWVLAAVSTLVFLFFVFMIMMVPGITRFTRTGMLSVVAIVVAIALGVGTWRFGNTETPITVSPLGPVVTGFLLLELAYCLIGIFLLATGISR